MSSRLKTLLLGALLLWACLSTNAVREGVPGSVQSATLARCSPDEFPPGWVSCGNLEGTVAQSPRDLANDTWGGSAEALLPTVGDVHAPSALAGGGVKCNSHTHDGVEHTGTVPCGGGKSASGAGHDRCDAVVEGQVMEHHEVFTTCALPPTLKGDLSDCVFGQTEAAPCTVTVVASFVQIDSRSKYAVVTGGPVTKRYNGLTTGQPCGCSKQRVSWSIDTKTCWKVSADTFQNRVCREKDEHLDVVRPVVTSRSLLWSAP